jgi:hypothetical protein
MRFLNRNKLWALLILLILGLMAYGMPRFIHETYTISWIDLSEKTVTKTMTVALDGSYYHRLMDADVLSGKLIIEGKEYHIIQPNYGYGGIWDGFDRKWHAPGVKATLLRNSTYLGWVSFSKDYKQMSGYFDGDQSDEIVFGGPAVTYDEAKAIFEELDF